MNPLCRCILLWQRLSLSVTGVAVKSAGSATAAIVVVNMRRKLPVVLQRALQVGHAGTPWLVIRLGC